jgi:hypothetical protein
MSATCSQGILRPVGVLCYNNLTQHREDLIIWRDKEGALMEAEGQQTNERRYLASFAQFRQGNWVVHTVRMGKQQ